MSDKDKPKQVPTNQQQERKQDQQGHSQEQQQEPQEQDPDVLTQQDQQTYLKIAATLDKMSSKLKRAKDRSSHNQAQTHAQKKMELVEKLITSKENSQIVTKENLIADVNQSYEKVVVQIYSENQYLKKQIKQMEQTIKDQNQKIQAHASKENELRKQNEALREQLNQVKDDKVMNNREVGPVVKNTPKNKESPGNIHQQKGQFRQDHNEDHDFWSMPQNQSYVSRKKDHVSDSGLWANQKDIGDSMFITQNQSRPRKQ